jgi:NAD(P)-dependent dehydrogenase (short-subunit alcohol dehydrogenase family)
MQRLEGRVIVVTGAGRGIGAGIAELCAREGGHLVVNDYGGSVNGEGTDQGPAHEVVERIKSAGGTAIAHIADVADSDQATDLIDATVREYGRIDALVNVAGILRDKMIYNLEPEDWDAVIRVHLRGTYNTTRIAAKWWRANANLDGHYRLVNTTSTSGIWGAAGQPNYAAAKLGIVGFTYSCANALMRYGVTANALSPAAATRMIGTIPGDRAAQLADLLPENVAPAVAYVVSDQSDWFTGQVFGAQGTTVELFNRPEVIREIKAQSSATLLDEVFDKFESTFRPALRPSGGRHEPTALKDVAARREAAAAESR